MTAINDLRAISLWPEWAYAVAHLGKNGENRTWPLPKARVGKPLLICAGMRPILNPSGVPYLLRGGRRCTDLHAFRRVAWEAVALWEWDWRSIEAARGRALALVLPGVSCLGAEVGDIGYAWVDRGPGMHFWPFWESVTLTTPLPVKGAQSLFRVAPGVAIEVARQVVDNDNAPRLAEWAARAIEEAT